MKAELSPWWKQQHKPSTQSGVFETQYYHDPLKIDYSWWDNKAKNGVGNVMRLIMPFDLRVFPMLSKINSGAEL